jgi:hypothetical protein
LTQLGLTPLTAADRCRGLDRNTVHGWFPNRNQPRARYKPRYPEQVRRFLEGNPEIDPAPYQDYWALPSSRVWCPDCQQPHLLSLKSINYIERRRQRAGEPPMPKRDDGSYLWRCADCRSRTALLKARKRRWELWRGEVNADLIDGKAIGAAVKAKLTGRPKTAAHRLSIAEAHILRGRVSKPIQACPLCGLWCERGWLRRGRQWHADCWETWKDWREHSPQAPPLPPAMTRGRRAGAHGNRDYRWFLVQILKKRLPELPERVRDRIKGMSKTRLLREALKSGQISRYRSLRPKTPSRTAVNRAAMRFFKRMPGSWNSLFIEPHWRWQSRSEANRELEWRKQRESRNTILQEYIPLPEAITALIASGARDRLIARLHGFDMNLDRIVRLTGAPLEHIRRVVASGLEHPKPYRPTPRALRIGRLKALGMKRETIALRLGCSIADVDAAAVAPPALPRWRAGATPRLTVVPS